MGDTTLIDRNTPSVRVDAESEPRPALVRDIELSRPFTAIHTGPETGGTYLQACLLVRLFGEPLGFITLDLTAGHCPQSDIAAAIGKACGLAISRRLGGREAAIEAALSGAGLETSDVPAFVAAQQQWKQQGPDITVVICTRNRPGPLARTLQSLEEQDYPSFRVLVVDNAPRDDRTRHFVANWTGSVPVDYTLEPQAGLSWARNHALQRLESPVVAWLDDDELADPQWLTEIAGGFCSTPGAAAVSGAVVPAELETWPQMWFEQYGGHSKGRGFEADVFGSGHATTQSPLYPLPPFGVGANMAFDVAWLRKLGGFDPALGAGTITCGAEDTLVFSRLLLSGATVVYRPSALTRHFHRSDMAGLTDQMRGYGIGLGAFYASLLRHNPKLILPLLQLLPTAIRDTLGSSGAAAGDLPDDFPRELLAVKARGLLRGPTAYMKARRRVRTLLASGSGT